MGSEAYEFAGQGALVFGGGKGIGRAVATEFARRGARLVVADIDLEAAHACAEAISATGGSAQAMSCDVTSIESVHDAAGAAREWLGEVDLVVNNVGAIISGHPEDIPLAEWRRILDLNLFSVIHSNEVFLPAMLARGSGYIVNTASFAGLYPYATNRMPYVASKAALVALSESLALYLLPRGIRVSCFCPGPVMTGVMQGMKSWSENAVMSGPGSQFELITAEQAAATLADGMQAGRIFIPTHESVIAEMRARAESPDQFIRDRIAAFERGELGLPSVPEHFRR
ncbi:SDR family NAD(P)-dependent oxidoreductase [Haliea sp. E17]|uniref:SDR family NAD(P)-dependent oxidoreductase n=1 Tax=Haliea sp. E17 TaxID=3401576 RepID=UPI003AABF3AB